MKYWLKKSCISLITIAVLATSLLAVDYPKDPPVTSGGEGPTGNDWTDFGVFSNNKLLWRDANDLNHVTSTYYIIIETANTNFVLANNRNTAGDKVKHTHYKDNYGDVSCPTVTDGNRYWDWFHEGYTPVTTRISNCSITKNCVSKAYHNYKGANTVSTNWTDPGNRAPFTGELYVIFGYGDNDGDDTQPGDRCDNSSTHGGSPHHLPAVLLPVCDGRMAPAGSILGLRCIPMTALQDEAGSTATITYVIRTR